MLMLEVTLSRLREVLDYDVETGWFTWKVKTAKNTIVGQRAGTEFDQIGGKKRRKIRIDGRAYLEHRLAWLYVHGEWPSGQLDHVNGDPRDNWIDNLRVATNAQNNWNKAWRGRNVSGYRGVSYDKDRNQFYARIRVNDKKMFLGRFNTAEDAAEAYIFAALEHHGEFARLEC